MIVNKNYKLNKTYVFSQPYIVPKRSQEEYLMG